MQTLTLYYRYDGTDTEERRGGGEARKGGRERDREGRKGQEKTLSEDKILGKFSFYLLYISF